MVPHVISSGRALFCFRGYIKLSGGTIEWPNVESRREAPRGEGSGCYSRDNFEI